MSLPFTSRSRGFGCALGVVLLLSGATAAQASAETASTARAQAAAAAATAALHPQLPSPVAATAAEERAVARTAATGSCPAQILKNGTLVTLKTTTYKYRFVKIKKGREQGQVPAHDRAREGRRPGLLLQAVRPGQEEEGQVPVDLHDQEGQGQDQEARPDRHRQAARRASTSSAAARTCRAPRSSASRSRSRSCPGSYALLDFGSFTRQAAISGTLRGFIPGRFKPNTDIQVTLTKAAISIGTDERLHRRRVQRPGVGGDPHRQPDDASARLRQDEHHDAVRAAARRRRSSTRASSCRSSCATRTPAATTRTSPPATASSRQTFFFRGKVGPKGLLRAAGQLAAGHPRASSPAWLPASRRSRATASRSRSRSWSASRRS